MIILFILLFITIIFRTTKEGNRNKRRKKRQEKKRNKRREAEERARRRMEEYRRLVNIEINKYNNVMNEKGYYDSEIYKIRNPRTYYDHNFNVVQPRSFKKNLRNLNRVVNKYNENFTYTLNKLISSIMIQQQNYSMIQKIKKLDPELNEVKNVNKLLKNDVNVLGP